MHLAEQNLQQQQQGQSKNSPLSASCSIHVSAAPGKAPCTTAGRCTSPLQSPPPSTNARCDDMANEAPLPPLQPQPPGNPHLTAQPSCSRPHAASVCSPQPISSCQHPAATMQAQEEAFLPVLDLAPYLLACSTPTGSTASLAEHVAAGLAAGGPLLNLPGKDPRLAELAAAVAQSLKETGCVVVRDPRVGAADMNGFLDMMERYFSQPDDVKRRDSRPNLHYQVGVTPEGVEVPRASRDAGLQAAIQQQPEGQRATLPAGADPKWRFMWRIGPRPQCTRFVELNAAPVVPDGFPEWAGVMDAWGSKMVSAMEAVAELAAVGFALPRDAFTSRMRLGPHLLAPTGADLARHCKPGACYAGYHTDLNFLTIHGKSRFPGLFVWLRDGRRVAARVPDGCLLLQAGRQLEWLTGGTVMAGFHEVVCTEATLASLRHAAAAGKPTWRVSSTMFGHIASDQILAPLGSFATPEALAAYPPTPAGEQVQRELEALRLKAPC